MSNFSGLRSLLSGSRIAGRSPIGRPIEMLEERTVPAVITGTISAADEVDRYALNASIGDHILVTNHTPVSHLTYDFINVSEVSALLLQTDVTVSPSSIRIEDDAQSSLPLSEISISGSHSLGRTFGRWSASIDLDAGPFEGRAELSMAGTSIGAPDTINEPFFLNQLDVRSYLQLWIACDQPCTVAFQYSSTSTSTDGTDVFIYRGGVSSGTGTYASHVVVINDGVEMYSVGTGEASGSISISWHVIQLVTHYVLFDPDGVVVAVDSELADYVATKSGQYTFAVTDRGDNDVDGLVEVGVDSTGDYQFTIEQISQPRDNIHVEPYRGLYDGNAHGIGATGANGEDLSSLLNFGAAYVDSGHYDIEWTFVGNSEYMPASGTSTIDIIPVPLTIDVGSLTKTYGDTAELFRLPALVSTGVDGEDLGISYDSEGVGAHADVLPGGYPITATVSDDTGKIANYVITINSGTLSVDPTTALIDIDRYDDVYDGNAHGLSGRASGVFGEDLSNLFRSFGEVFVDAGHYWADWTFAGNNNYQPAHDTGTIDISRFRSIARIDSVEPLTYDGLGHGTAGQVLGINGIVLTSSVTYSDEYGNPVDGVPLHAGDYTASISFPGDNNYTFALAVTHIVIRKADAVVDVPSVSFRYDGNAHFLIGTATGVQGENLDNMLNILSPTIDAGIYPIIWIFSGNIDYNRDSGISFLIIDKAPPTASITAVAPTVYDGHAHGTTGEVVGVKGVVLPCTITYRDDRDNLLNGAPVNAGTYTAKISFSGDDNYLPASASTIIVIDKATPAASIDPVTANYDATGHGTHGVVLGINGVVLPSIITYRDSQDNVLSGFPVYAGVYTATIFFPGNNNYTAGSASSTVVILSAKDQLTLLIDDVADLGLNGGTTNALTTKLSNAFTKLSQGNTTAGVNLMLAFINQVGAFAYSGKLSLAQADALIAAANSAIYSATH